MTRDPLIMPTTLRVYAERPLAVLAGVFGRSADAVSLREKQLFENPWPSFMKEMQVGLVGYALPYLLEACSIETLPIWQGGLGAVIKMRREWQSKP